MPCSLSSSSPPPYPIIVLIGLMGAGKTTLGRLLAQQYNIPFVDSDVEVEKAAGSTIADIFTQHGEAHFREGEHRVIIRLLRGGSCVLATGGGAWMDARTRKAIRETPQACTVWLHVSPDILFRRMTNSRTIRPLLTQHNPREALHTLASHRYPVYAQADVTVYCGENNMTEAVKKIHDTLTQLHSPQCVPIKLSHHSYNILTGPHLIERAASLIGPYLSNNHAVIITDETVAQLHLDTLVKAFNHTNIRLNILRIPVGESSKSLSRYSLLIEQILHLGIERHTTIIAFGGGVVGDLSGFIAATALRGLPFIQIPTTLLAQVDSSVGGKTGINAPSGKNLIGAFWQPHLVLADTEVLQTLPSRQRIAGYAEIIKAGLISSPELFDWCEKHGAAVIDGCPSALEEAVQRACRFKAHIVAQDERESTTTNGRALLNLGHTFAHAFEAEFHYDGRLLHGEAVSIGLHMTLSLSVEMGLAPLSDLERLDAHLKTIGMPTTLADLPHPLSASILIEHMRRDKKVQNNRIKFVLLRKIGQAFTSQDVSLKEVNNFLCKEGCLL